MYSMNKVINNLREEKKKLEDKLEAVKDIIMQLKKSKNFYLEETTVYALKGLTPKQTNEVTINALYRTCELYRKEKLSSIIVIEKALKILEAEE